MGCSGSKPSEGGARRPSLDRSRIEVKPRDGQHGTAPGSNPRAGDTPWSPGRGGAGSEATQRPIAARHSSDPARPEPSATHSFGSRAAAPSAGSPEGEPAEIVPKTYGEAQTPEWDPDHGTGTRGSVSLRKVESLEQAYEVLPQRLGKGSFGEVMLARRIEDAGREDAPLFAIKKLKPDVRNMAATKAKRVAAVAQAAGRIRAMGLLGAKVAAASVPPSAAGAGAGAGAGKVASAAASGTGDSTRPVTDASGTGGSGNEGPGDGASTVPVSGKQAGLAGATAGGAAAVAELIPGLGGRAGESKSTMVNKSKESAFLEGDIMNRVRGHRNVVNIEDMVEDDTCVHLVMEYCQGGDLMKYVVRCSHFSEKVASYLFRQMLVGVAHCHARGVVHRDLKPENFLFASTEGKAELKIADFGLATVIAEPQEEITDGVGSAFFIAPEVLARRYTSSCDIWSLGVNLYLLLSGTVPFGAAATKAAEVYRAIRTEPLTFSGKAWGAISPLARELVAGLLEKQPFRRYTLAQALAHPWVTGDGAAPDTPLDSSVIRAMTHFNARNRLRREALRLISSTLSADDLKVLAGQFHAMDTDADMLITYQELAAAIRKMGIGDSATEDEVMRAMEAMDADRDGTIDLQEFLAATSELQMIEHQNNIWWAFCQYDKNGDGTITLDELRDVLKGDDEAKLLDYIREYDADQDGRISYEEFIRMLVPPDMEFTTIRY